MSQRNPGSARMSRRFFAAVLPEVFARCLLVYLLCAGVALGQTPRSAAAESPEIEEAFSRLDALAENVASRLEELTRTSHSSVPAPAPVGDSALPPAAPTTPGVPPSTAAPQVGAAPPVPPSANDAGSTASLGTDEPAEPEACGSRESMALSMDEMDGQYDEFKQVILAVHGDLPTHRRNLLDDDKICAPKTKSSITSDLRKLRNIDVGDDLDMAIGLLACVDRLRRGVDEEMEKTTSIIRLRRLSGELERLTGMTNRAQNMEEALRRADSKLRRLGDELSQLKHELDTSCE